MRVKILYILSTYNIYGGTPKKTLDLMEYFGGQSVLYVYQYSYLEFKHLFEETKGKVYDGFYGRNIFKHLKSLLKIIDQENINVIQTQFSMGETLGFLIKLFRPKIKLIVAFVGPFQSSLIKKLLAGLYYKFADQFVYITHYVKSEKFQQYPILKKKRGKIIYNGTKRRIDNGKEIVHMKKYSLLDIAGLIYSKNIQILIEAFHILINQRKRQDIFLYVAGDGPKRAELERLIEKYELQNHIYLLGYQENVGRLINDCDIFVHPSYAEGFGIAVAEAMIAGKPIIASDAGALPELIEPEKSGLIVKPHDAEEWVEAIIYLINNPEICANLASNAMKRANELFSLNQFYSNYETLYQNITAV